MMLTDDEVQECLKLLRRAASLDPQSEAFLSLEREAAFLRKETKKTRKRARRRCTAEHDRALKRATGLAQERLGQTEGSGEDTELRRDARCYCCGQRYRVLHSHFHCLCDTCGDDSLARRKADADLSGRIALVTGGRIKVGYHTAVRLLQLGATVHITSRFPRDARQRYSGEADYPEWKGRLHIHQLDFRDISALVAWIRGPGTAAGFDIVINNAAQTVWRPPEYYRELWDREDRLTMEGDEPLSAPSGVRGEKGGVSLASRIGEGLTKFGDPIDLRRENSWVQELGEIAPVELLESQVVNNMAPFLICNGLLESMSKAKNQDRYIVNVAAAEGQFERANKPSRHPHTNMAKAAVNMLTRTSAEQCAAMQIYMVSVDPGWVSHEVPHEQALAAHERGFHTPLEMADAAARLLHPILAGIRGVPIYGKLLKDFAVVPW